MYRFISFIVIFSFVSTVLYFYFESRDDHDHSQDNPHPVLLTHEIEQSHDTTSILEFRIAK